MQILSLVLPCRISKVSNSHFKWGLLTFVLDPHSRSKGLNLWGYYNLCFRRLNNDDSTIYVLVSTRATADLC